MFSVVLRRSVVEFFIDEATCPWSALRHSWSNLRWWWWWWCLGTARLDCWGSGETDRTIFLSFFLSRRGENLKTESVENQLTDSSKQESNAENISVHSYPINLESFLQAPPGSILLSMAVFRSPVLYDIWLRPFRNSWLSLARLQLSLESPLKLESPGAATTAVDEDDDTDEAGSSREASAVNFFWSVSVTFWLRLVTRFLKPKENFLLLTVTINWYIIVNRKHAWYELLEVIWLTEEINSQLGVNRFLI